MTLGADLRVLGGFLCTFQAWSWRTLGKISFLKGGVLFKAAAGWGVGWAFRPGQVAFLKAFPGREPGGGMTPFASGNAAPPEQQARRIQLSFLAFYFPSDRSCVRLERLGLERNRALLISLLRAHIFQVLTLRF